MRKGIALHSPRHVPAANRMWWVWLVLFVAVGLCISLPSQAFNSAEVKAVATLLTRGSKWYSQALHEDEIADLSQMARQAGGTKAVGKYLGAKQLPPDVIEDTYLRIAVHQQTISRSEAEGMCTRLRGIRGFQSTLSKVIGNSDAKTAGHLNELRIADTAAQHRFTVMAVGERFNDGVKTAETDIDVLLEKGGKVIAIEAKDYAATTPIPMDSFRADMVSLTQYTKSQPQGRVLPVFTITNRPLDANAWRTLQLETKRREIQLIEGSPPSQIEQIKMLLRIK